MMLRMKNWLWLLLAAFLTLTAFADTGDSIWQPNLKAFVQNAEACEHFAGEVDPDDSKARRKEIDKGIMASCGKAKQQRSSLLKKYANDAAAKEVLNRYESVTHYIGPTPKP